MAHDMSLPALSPPWNSPMPPDHSSAAPVSELDRRTALFTEMQAISHRTTVPSFRGGLAVENKQATGTGFDPVTEADRACERALRALVETHFPKDGIIGEEYGTTRADAPFVWVIDPIDGTRAYVAGVPLWGTLVGIMASGKPVAGMACQPFIGESFATIARDGHVHAEWSKGDARRNLASRRCASLAAASLATTTPALFSEQERAAYDGLEGAVRTVRYGTDWYAYALVASGTLDLVVESGLSPYDVLPLVAIIEAAGGAVMDWSGRPLSAADGTFTGQVVALGDASLAPQVLERLRPAAAG